MTWQYFRARCFAEGISKAMVANIVGAGQGLSTERKYTARILPVGILRGILDAFLKGDLAGLLRASAIATGLGFATAGYLTGSILAHFRLASTSLMKPAQKGQPTRMTGLSNSMPAEPLKVLMVTPRYLPEMGGVENHVYQVAGRLAQAGVQVSVLTTDREGKLTPCERVNEVHIQRVRAWPARRDYYFAPGIYRYIQQHQWDLIHIQSYHTLVAPLAMLAARQVKIPYVLTFHGGGHSSSLRKAAHGSQLALLRPFLARAERLVALAHFEEGFF